MPLLSYTGFIKIIVVSMGANNRDRTFLDWNEMAKNYSKILKRIVSSEKLVVFMRG